MIQNSEYKLETITPGKTDYGPGWKFVSFDSNNDALFERLVRPIGAEPIKPPKLTQEHYDTITDWLKQENIYWEWEGYPHIIYFRSEEDKVKLILKLM